MKKRFFIALIVLTTLIFQFSFAYTFPTLVKVNDTYVKVENIIVRDGVYYAPARQMADSLRAITQWEVSSQSAHFIKFNNRLIVSGDRVKIYRNDKFVGIDLTVCAVHHDNHIYLPVEYFANFFGATIRYDEKLFTFFIEDPSIDIADATRLIALEDADDVLWLARIINLEARGNSLYKRLAIGGVVMNRVNSPNFPNTVYDVIKAKGQFPPAYYKDFDTMVPLQSSMTAAIHAFNGENVIEDCLYFNLKPFSWKSKADYYGEIEGDYFYR